VTRWTCPECGRQFGRTRQGHECAPALTLEEYFSTGPERERRIFEAVLDNAVRYGAPPVRIDVAAGDRSAVVVVTDHGPGVPAAELGLVVEPFFRGERAVLEHHSLGLGLAVARALAEQHDGELAVRNRAGGGLEVELRLPVA